jgi:hypothetical protein
MFIIRWCDVQVVEMSGETSLQPEPTGEGTPQPMSPIDVSDGEQDEALLKLNEDELREMQKVNSIQCIQRMRISPMEESRFHIPLCRMVYMPLVRPTLAIDIKRLEAEFTHGYRPGAGLSYMTDGGENLSYNDVTDGRSDMSIRYLTGSCKNRITCPDSFLHFTPR